MCVCVCVCVCLDLGLPDSASGEEHRFLDAHALLHSLPPGQALLSLAALLNGLDSEGEMGCG